MERYIKKKDIGKKRVYMSRRGEKKRKKGRKGKFFFFGKERREERRLKRAMYGELSRSIPRSGR